MCCKAPGLPSSSGLCPCPYLPDDASAHRRPLTWCSAAQTSRPGKHSAPWPLNRGFHGPQRMGAFLKYLSRQPSRNLSAARHYPFFSGLSLRAMLSGVKRLEVGETRRLSVLEPSQGEVTEAAGGRLTHLAVLFQNVKLRS